MLRDDNKCKGRRQKPGSEQKVPQSGATEENDEEDANNKTSTTEITEIKSKQKRGLIWNSGSSSGLLLVTKLSLQYRFHSISNN